MLFWMFVFVFGVILIIRLEVNEKKCFLLLWCLLSNIVWIL